jgi:hypothetical protein
MLMRIIGAAATSVCIATGSFGQTGAIDQAKQIPAYSLPIPEDISPKMRALVGGAACAVGHSPEKHCRTETARRQSGGSGKKSHSARNARECARDERSFRGDCALL